MTKITNREFNSIVDKVRRDGAHSIRVKRIGGAGRNAIVLRFATREGFQTRKLENHCSVAVADNRGKLLAGWLEGVK